jgi:uncharacterized protein (TIGR02246 family)
VSRSAQRLLLLAFVALGLTFAVARFGLGPARARGRGRPSRTSEPRESIPSYDDAARSLAVHAAIAQANEGLLEALARSDARAYAEHFAEDGLSMPGYGPIVRGREAIAAAMAHTFAKLRFAEVDVSTLDTRHTGETVLETGRYRYVVAARESDARQTLTGRYVIVWKRVGDRWKIALDAAQPGAAEG